MPVADQGIDQKRYMLIPRTAIFLRRGESYLLMQGAATKRLWAGKYNGLGGHVERGEDVMSSARRELREESGLEADLWLCGTVIVDAGATGICLYVFSGESLGSETRPSPEGSPEWVEYEDVPTLPGVDDLGPLLARIHAMRRGDAAFSARSYYDDKQRLVLDFVE